MWKLSCPVIGRIIRRGDLQQGSAFHQTLSDMTALLAVRQSLDHWHMFEYKLPTFSFAFSSSPLHAQISSSRPVGLVLTASWLLSRLSMTWVMHCTPTLSRFSKHFSKRKTDLCQRRLCYRLSICNYAYAIYNPFEASR
jgi:hypothetical protein